MEKMVRLQIGRMLTPIWHLVKAMIEWNEVINVNIASRRCCQGVPLFRLSHLSRCAGAQLQNLFVVMPSMNHVEFSPLWRSQRAQNRMVKDVDAASEARFTLRDDGIHR